MAATQGLSIEDIDPEKLREAMDAVGVLWSELVKAFAPLATAIVEAARNLAQFIQALPPQPPPYVLEPPPAWAVGW